MQAILEIKQGERPYRIIRSDWLKDSDGLVLFKLLSKLRADGKIETAYVVERRNGRKTILATTVTNVDKFMDAVSAFRQLVWQIFPDADLRLEDVMPIDYNNPQSSSQYSVAKNSFWGLLRLRLKKWLRF